MKYKYSRKELKQVFANLPFWRDEEYSADYGLKFIDMLLETIPVKEYKCKSVTETMLLAEADGMNKKELGELFVKTVKESKEGICPAGICNGGFGCQHKPQTKTNKVIDKIEGDLEIVKIKGNYFIPALEIGKLYRKQNEIIDYLFKEEK